MTQEKAQEVVKTCLSEEDTKEFDRLLEITKDPASFNNEKMIKCADELTALFDRNELEPIALPKGKGEFDFFVMHKGVIVE